MLWQGGGGQFPPNLNLAPKYFGYTALCSVNYVYIIQPEMQIVPINCDVSFAIGELQQAYGHVMLPMSM